MDPINEFLEDLQVVIVHGGPGTRLKHITGSNPKGLLVVYNDGHEEKTLIDYEIQLWDPYCTNIVVLLSESTVAVRSYLEKRYPQLAVRYSIESAQLGKGGSIKRAIENGVIDPKKQMVATFPDDFKLLKELPYEIAKAHLKGRKLNCIATDVMVKGTKYPYGSAEVDDRGVVTEKKEYPFIELPTSMGVYIFDPPALELFPPSDPRSPYDFETVVLPRIVSRRQLYSCVLPYESWIPVNDDKGYATAKKVLKEMGGKI